MAIALARASSSSDNIPSAAAHAVEAEDAHSSGMSDLSRSVSCDSTLSDYEMTCAVCLQTLCQPVQWPAGCGHAFCRLCAWQCLLTKSVCPLCRAPESRPAPALPTDLIVDEELAEIVHRSAPERYAARSRTANARCRKLSANVLHITLFMLERTAKIRPRLREGTSLSLVIRKRDLLLTLLNAPAGCQIGVVAACSSPTAGSTGNLATFTIGRPTSRWRRLYRKPKAPMPLTADVLRDALDNEKELRLTLHVGASFKLLADQTPLPAGTGGVVRAELLEPPSLSDIDLQV